ncbi:non-ribosomal peptide synthetase [Streptomyces hygroscopicus]|uniref:non-ribosomal peptide synthetase n=1 Tax=Streptomyces hygroscopicus TaxID=1912 RepID=UPI00223F1802|nr:non-ribosomal peptide synthetase [Streptomyces hygroscopicus]
MSRSTASDHDLVAAFEERVRIAPESPAVSCQGELASFAELNSRADRLVRRLAARGVGPGSVIGVCLPRGLGLVTVLLGVLKAGAVYVPLDPDSPTGRLNTLLDDAGAHLVIADSHCSGGLSREVRPVLDLDAVESVDGPAEDAISVGVASDLAYLVFTSGSTGEPKPVAVSRGSLTHHATTVADVYELVPQDKVLQFASPAFDVAAEEIFPTLVSGACVVVFPDRHRSPRDLERFIREEGVTVANLPSSYWEAWVSDLDADPRELPSRLRLLIVGSEMAYTRTLARWRRHSPIRIINAYGLTETTITAVLGVFEGHVLPPGDILPIGRPLPGVVAYVLGPGMEPVAAGATGELYVGGAALARGYHNRPDLTADRFVPAPFNGRPEARLCRTGDLAVRDAHGTLTCLGRVDDQVKIRGHRVQPAEVTAAILSCPGVRQACVRSVTDERGTRLIAYVVPEEGSSDCDTLSLRARLAGTLPPPMVPAEFLTMPELPLTPNGKIDHRALPLPPTVQAPVVPDAQAILSPAEQLVARIWREALRIPAVGLDDNFFDIGGDSLLLVGVRRQLGHTLDAVVPSAAPFEYTTVRSLARFLQSGPMSRTSGGGSEDADRGELRRRARTRRSPGVSQDVQGPARSPEEPS